jgi:hypothetical protein|eukprot:COSAG06_NODE_366_length_16768_cov_145.097246_5_plen_47_part_00
MITNGAAGQALDKHDTKAECQRDAVLGLGRRGWRAHGGQRAGGAVI